MAEWESAFRDVTKTGVIYVMTEAQRHGYREHAADWVNFGQGQPETGLLPGGPARLTSLPLALDSLEYGPVAGLWELRAAVADHYNQLYRRGMPSKYSAENVCIGPGGRAVLTRAVTCLGNINLGHLLPDYTAYEELLGNFRSFTPMPILLDPAAGYSLSPAQLATEISGRGLGALLLSNPHNPTGTVLAGESLRGWVEQATARGCLLLIDEFYSRYLWREGLDSVGNGISAATYIEDLEAESALIINGLTKNWRYPGLRISWALGPKKMVEAMASAGSFLDGGAVRATQQAVLGLLEPAHARQETLSMRACFRDKRRLLLDGLHELGVRVPTEPQGAFYIWGELGGLPPTLRDGTDFFKAALAHKVITVPGCFFDVDPGQRRRGRSSRFADYVRFSYGPPAERLQQGLKQLGELLRAHGA